MIDDIIIAIVLGIAGIIVTWFASRRYYRKGSEEIKKEIDTAVSKLESLENAKMRIADNENPKRDKPIKTKDGKWKVSWNRSIVEENIPVTDSIGVKVRRWHDDPNGSELVNGRRGYYTDEKYPSPKDKYREESIEHILTSFSDVLKKTNFEKKTIEAIEESLNKNYKSNKEYVELALLELKKKYKDKEEIQKISLRATA